MLPKFETKGLVRLQTSNPCSGEYQANPSPLSSEFKLKVVLDALKERQSLAELSQKYEVSQVMISRWKTEFLEAAPRIFSKAKKEDTKSLEAANEKVYSEIVRQKIEIDFLKKFTRNWGNESPRPFRETRLDLGGTQAI
jgi:transposase